MSLKKYYTIIIILFAVYFINGIVAIPQLSITGDEGDHLNYAMRLAKGYPEKVKPFDDASTMPMSVVNVIPRAVEQIFQPTLSKNDWGRSDIFSGRYMTLLMSALIGFFILKCSTELYGRKAGLFSLFLFVFCPNLNGHNVLVTTDAFSALFTLTSTWYFRKVLLNAGWKDCCLFGFHLGMAQLSKQSLTHLYIVFVLIFLFYLLSRKVHLQTKAITGKILLVTLVTLLVINAGFLFRGTGTSWGQYQFRSSFFAGVQDKLSFMGSIPLPLPEPYLSGLDLTKNIDEIGPGHPESSGSVYILGNRKDGEGFWYYYFVVLFFKTPIPVVIFFLFFLLSLIKNRPDFFKNEFIFISVITYFLIYFSFFYNSQVGIRHILMIFPLLYVLLGRIAEQLWRKQILASALALYSVITFYYYYPNLIAYSNEFIWQKRNAYKIMADSNLDYGQGHILAQRYIAKHPDTHFADTIPTAGKQLLRVSSYLDLANENKYAWLKRFKPVSHVAHSYLLFDIKPADIGEN
jgi:hypothetical protein